MGILTRSKKAIKGLEFDLSDLKAKFNKVQNDLLNEINRAKSVESSLNTDLGSVKNKVDILNGDANTIGSVDHKLNQMMLDYVKKSEVYTKVEIDEKLANKVDKNYVKSPLSDTNKIVTETELSTKANSADVYTKTDVDNKLATKANVSDVYTKTDVDNKLATKADKDSVYTKSDVDALVSSKANVSDVYTKSDVDDKLATKLNKTDAVSEVSSTNKLVTQTELATKANVSDVYTKTDVDNKLNTKVNVSDVLSPITDTNKVVTQTELNKKANSADVYTKTQIDDTLATKADKADLGKIGPSLIVVDETNKGDGKVLAYDETNNRFVYTSISSDDGSATIDDDNVALDKTWSSQKISNELAAKADKDSVYTKSEVDERVTTSAFGIKYSVDTADDLSELNANENELAVVKDERKVYKYDGTQWVEFFTLDPANYDDRYYTQTQVDEKLATKADKDSVYTKSDVDEKLATKADKADLGKIGPSLIVVDETDKGDGKVLAYDEANNRFKYVEQTADIIDDENVASDKTWSSQKISEELSTKADKANVYTKTDVDNALAQKVNVSDVKSEISSSNKIVTEAELATKADSANVYTKPEIDDKLANKVNVSDVKSALSDSNKIVTEAELATKANVDDVYTKTDVDNKLATKADKDSVYTKSDVDTKLADKLDKDLALSTVTEDNKLVTQNELNLKANLSDVYTKSEVDDKLATKFDNNVALSEVSETNKIATANELAQKVNVSDVKSPVSSTNKIVTETDVAQEIQTKIDNLQLTPFVIVDRPTLYTKSVDSDTNTYVFAFKFSRKPLGNYVINDEITIYDFTADGESIIFENIAIDYENKEGSITVVLENADDEDKYKDKKIKVSYLTTETFTIGADEQHPIIISVDKNFEDQGGDPVDYPIDFSKGSYYRINFADGIFVMVAYDPTHQAQGGWIDGNSDDYQASLYMKEEDFPNTRKLVAYPSLTDGDEAQFTDYNWKMFMKSTDNENIYNIEFQRGDAVGGGAL